MSLVETVATAIKKEYYGSEDYRFGDKEAKAAIVATIQWLKKIEDEEYLTFLFPAIDTLEEELKKYHI